MSNHPDASRSKELLKQEGFKHVHVWQDGPNASYVTHTHQKKTAHIILDGEMTISVEGVGTFVLKRGDRYDVPAHTPHSARMGASGCCYIVGE